jgi:hypothetical protein
MLSAISQGLKNDPGGSGHGFQARVESLESVRHGVKEASAWLGSFPHGLFQPVEHAVRRHLTNA